MTPELHFDILPSNQKALWSTLSAHASTIADGGYYLAGGTALALQIGHRQSVDFDFFSTKTSQRTPTMQWLEQLPQWVLRGTGDDTIDGEIGGVKVSFIASYKYPLVLSAQSTNGIAIASIADIGLMKLLAITHRNSMRDYVDLAVIIRDYHSLTYLLELLERKYGKPPDRMLILRALVSFDDLDTEMPRMFDRDLQHSWKEILRGEMKSIAG